MTLRRPMAAITFALAWSASLVAPAHADDEASNRATVTASQYGNCYAKSVPANSYGNEGQTQIFMVEEGADVLVATYAWYAQSLRLECNVAGADGAISPAIVQFGPWSRGRQASADELAIAFYRDDQMLRAYSTLDIAGSPENVRASVSHYTVIESIGGFRWRDDNRYAFDVRTIDGREIVFDAGTGDIISPPNP